MLQSSTKLLIVEDQPLIAEMLEDLAVTLGWEVAAIAYSAQGALMALEDLRPTLAVLDIDLGDSTSVGVAAICHSRNIPVIFITGFSTDEVPPECANAPVLIKPFSEEAFANAVRDAMADSFDTDWISAKADSRDLHAASVPAVGGEAAGLIDRKHGGQEQH